MPIPEEIKAAFDMNPAPSSPLRKSQRQILFVN